MWRERGKNTAEVWRRATFIRRAFRMVGSPEHDHVTLPSKRALFASSCLPPSFFSLSVFEMKEFFLPNCAVRQILERCNRKCYTIFLTGAIDILDSCDTLIFFSHRVIHPSQGAQGIGNHKRARACDVCLGAWEISDTLIYPLHNDSPLRG